MWGGYAVLEVQKNDFRASLALSVWIVRPVYQLSCVVCLRLMSDEEGLGCLWCANLGRWVGETSLWGKGV